MSEDGESPGQVWRVQVLPLGTVSYRGRELDFTREYLAGLEEAFAERAFDYVPFQVSDAHTSDPACWHGNVVALDVVSDGLDAVVAVTPAGDALLAANPGFLAAPRLVENYQRADGRSFPAAIQHLLGTGNPVITGLRPWARVTRNRLAS